MDLADRDRARVDEELERLRPEPFLGAFAAPLPKLVDEGGDAARAFDRMGELLGASEEAATLHFRVREGDDERSFVVHTGAEGSKVTSEVVGRPDVEVIVSAETWNEIAAGAISPLEAFG
ncbi:MAG TPA: hypothetical protein VHN37_04095, partial [Actinomycetota bacterium]|nr:hypothetical protein [Actinomycetota bacterium]